jgi:hypothetical protein
MMAKKEKIVVEKPEVDEGEGGRQTLYFNLEWRVVNDGLQYIVQQGITRGADSKFAGTVVWKNMAYIRHFGNVLMWMADNGVKMIPGTYGPDTVDTMIAGLDKLHEEIRTVMKEFMSKRLNVRTGKIEEEA